MTLTCARARELASELLDGELTEELATAVQEHVATCPSCPQLYRSMVLVHTHLRELPGPPSSAQAAALASIREAIRLSRS